MCIVLTCIYTSKNLGEYTLDLHEQLSFSSSSTNYALSKSYYQIEKYMHIYPHCTGIHAQSTLKFFFLHPWYLLDNQSKFHNNPISSSRNIRVHSKLHAHPHTPCTHAHTRMPTNNNNQLRRPILTYTEIFVKIGFHLAEISRCVTR